MATSLIALARRAARPGAVGAALGALAELRARLSELERERVAEAIAAGWSWSQIAARLGVSKQAAHRKHAEAARALARAEGRPTSRDRLVIAGEARAAVRFAGEAAARLGNRQVGPAHLLLGALEAADPPLVNRLDEAGLSVNAARRELAALYGRQVAGKLELGAAPDPNAKVPLSARGRAALEGSLREAVRLDGGRLGVGHLLLALLRMSEGSSVELLRNLGLSASALATAVTDALRDAEVEARAKPQQ